MAKQNFSHYTKRDKPRKRPKYGVGIYHKQTRKKRPGRHKKSLNKSEKRQKKKK